jgi:hypothetical protein
MRMSPVGRGHTAGISSMTAPPVSCVRRSASPAYRRLSSRQGVNETKRMESIIRP